MNDIVKRLRAALLDRDNFPYMDSELRVGVGTAREAADEIESLRARLAEAEKQLDWAKAVNKELVPYQDRAVHAEARLADTTSLLRWIDAIGYDFNPKIQDQIDSFLRTADREDASHG